MLEKLGPQDKSSVILDLGCGTGKVGRCLRDSDFKGQLLGIDGSSKMLEKAKLKNAYDKLDLKLISAEQPITEKDSFFDGV